MDILEGQKEQWLKIEEQLKEAVRAEKAKGPENQFLDKRRDYETAIKRAEQLKKELEEITLALASAEKEAKKSREAPRKKSPGCQFSSNG